MFTVLRPSQYTGYLNNGCCVYREQSNAQWMKKPLVKLEGTILAVKIFHQILLYSTGTDQEYLLLVKSAVAVIKLYQASTSILTI